MDVGRQGLILMCRDKSIVAVFDSTFESLLSTALICEAIDAKTVHKDNFNSYMIAEKTKIIRTDDHEGSLTFEDALKIYQKRRGCFRLSERELMEIESLITWSLRYKKSDISTFALALKTLRRCLTEGAGVVMSQVTPEGREIYKRSRKVKCEYHKACGFLRLNVIGNFLVTEAEFEHDVEDLIVRFWNKRYPEKRVMLFSKSKEKTLACMGYKGTISLIEGEEVSLLRQNLTKETEENSANSTDRNDSDEEIERIYETFYVAQYIPSRKNKRLARRFVPKKFSKRFRMKEGPKIEHGIQKTKLDLFSTTPSGNSSVKDEEKTIQAKPKS
jgi:probable DNA metabolism protein